MCSSVGMHWPESLASKGFSFQSAGSMTITVILNFQIKTTTTTQNTISLLTLLQFAGNMTLICRQYDDMNFWKIDYD